MSFVPSRLFASAASYYDRYRSRYPGTKVADLARRLDINRSHTVADVGCGTGQLTIALARFAGRVVAIDPVNGMLLLGEQAAVAEGVTNITWRRGDSGQLDRLIPAGIVLASFAASFHWMDRSGVARTLDRLLAPTGAIVTINEILRDEEQPDWARAADEVRRRYLGDDFEAEVATFTGPAQDHRSVLAASPFCDIESVIWEWERSLTAEGVVGLQFSYSVSTPERLGLHAAGFARDVDAAVRAAQPDGVFIEPFRVEVLIARRPTGDREKKAESVRADGDLVREVLRESPVTRCSSMEGLDARGSQARLT
jgi:ubiquinone/menaquinone biosynthesis C-methylase UbiE